MDLKERRKFSKFILLRLHPPSLNPFQLLTFNLESSLRRFKLSEKESFESSPIQPSASEPNGFGTFQSRFLLRCEASRFTANARRTPNSPKTQISERFARLRTEIYVTHFYCHRFWLELSDRRRWAQPTKVVRCEWLKRFYCLPLRRLYGAHNADKALYVWCRINPKQFLFARHSLSSDESRGLKIIYFHLTRPRYSHWMVRWKIERIIQSAEMMVVKGSRQCVIYQACEPVTFGCSSRTEGRLCRWWSFA